MEGQLFCLAVCSQIQNPNSKIQIVNSSITQVLGFFPALAHRFLQVNCIKEM